MNDFDTEFIAPEEIERTVKPVNMSRFRLEVNIHVVYQGTTHSKEKEK